MNAQSGGTTAASPGDWLRPVGGAGRRIESILRTGAALACAAVALHAAPSARTDRILIKPKAGGGFSSAAAVNGSSVRRVFRRLSNWQVLQLPPGMDVATALALCQRSGVVEAAEPDIQVHIASTSPNDFYYQTGQLWGLHNTGYLSGTPGADIKAPEAWDIRTSAANIIVAMVDTGVRQMHEDLAANLWVNPAETAGNGIDDDGDGYIDDVHGINAILGSGSPEDDNGHGTHVAGIIGALGNNTVGVVGVAWRVQLMPLKAFDAEGNSAMSDIIECIEYARAHGAKIINASWGWDASTFDSTALREAISAARDDGVLVVCAAGNNTTDIDAHPFYPAGFNLDNVISVAATDRNDQLAFFSDYGATSVHLGAPGYNIFSTWIGSNSDYQYFDGTSMATAVVSGASALLRAQFPSDTPAQIVHRIDSTTDPLPTLLGKTISGGRLNLFRALGGLAALDTIAIAATQPNASESGTPAVFTVTRTGAADAPLTIHYVASGTATNGVDYAALPATIVLPAGSSSASITVQPIDDSQVEGPETVILTVIADPSYTLGAVVSATATIADNDQLPVVTAAAAIPAAAEGGAAGAFTLTRTGPATSALTVHFALGGTATNGSDYSTIATTAVIPAGAASVAVSVRPIDDTLVEGDETVVLTLSPDSTYTLGNPAAATVTIADNDHPATTVTILPTLPLAMEGSFLHGQFTVFRTASTASALTVHFVISGTATNGTDYQNIATSVVIPAGKSSSTVAVVPISDSKREKLETVTLAIASSPATYSVGSLNQASVWIIDSSGKGFGGL